MPGLPLPDVPPGPRRHLAHALHDLHHRAGWPSLRTLAREAGCSHTTISAVFSAPRCPAWGTLELVVEALDGDVHTFHDLWLAASAPAGAPAPAGASTIAGRSDELVALHHHLEAGTGLLLVTGETGIGKTRLVTTAAARTSADTYVATGHCLPLSTEVELLPISDVLRSVHAADEGRWVRDALTSPAPYVEESLQYLLPDLGGPAPMARPTDHWTRQRLFAAVDTIFTHLAELRPFAILLEDLHWADNATLDLLEHMLASDRGPPLVATWRLDDATTRRAATEWATRVRRMPSVQSLALRPLTRDQTAEQLALLERPQDSGYADRIHRRSQGHPLFTEQLAAHVGDDEDEDLPDLLADLFDQRLGGLGPAAWSIARVLGVADRPLDDSQVLAATGLSAADLREGLHELDSRRLLRPSAGRDLQLRHPLLAEAIRRRLLSLDRLDDHHRLARILAGDLHPTVGEITAPVAATDALQAIDKGQSAAIAELALAERAATAHESLTPAEAYVRSRLRQSGVLRGMGRYREAKEAIERATEAASAVDDAGLLRLVLVELAWHDALAGDLDTALSRAEQAWAVGVAPALPQNEVYLGVAYTGLLLKAARPAEEIAAVAVRGLRSAASWGAETYAVSLLRSHVVEGFLRSGQVGRAADLVDPVTASAPRRSTWAEHLERVAVDLRRGLLGDAAERLGLVSSLEPPTLVDRMELGVSAADIDLWRGDPHRAVDRLLPVLSEAAGSDASQELGAMLVRAARATADVADVSGREPGLMLLATLDDLLSSCRRSPFGPGKEMASRRARPATWRAERARLLGTATVERWAAAAGEWDRLTQPHEAAYCRWRGAEVALEVGQRTLAGRLVRRAAADAREHVPLRRALDRLRVR